MIHGYVVLHTDQGSRDGEADWDWGGRRKTKDAGWRLFFRRTKDAGRRRTKSVPRALILYKYRIIYNVGISGVLTMLTWHIFSFSPLVNVLSDGQTHWYLVWSNFLSKCTAKSRIYFVLPIVINKSVDFRTRLFRCLNLFMTHFQIYHPYRWILKPLNEIRQNLE